MDAERAKRMEEFRAWVAEHPEAAKKVIAVAERLKSKWSAEKSDRLL